MFCASDDGPGRILVAFQPLSTSLRVEPVAGAAAVVNAREPPSFIGLRGIANLDLLDIFTAFDEDLNAELTSKVVRPPLAGG
jgi:hypothetical protein